MIEQGKRPFLQDFNVRSSHKTAEISEEGCTVLQCEIFTGLLVIYTHKIKLCLIPQQEYVPIGFKILKDDYLLIKLWYLDPLLKG